MTVKEDGSLGVWGGKKFEGLGVQNVIKLLYSNSQLLDENKVWIIIKIHLT